MGKPSVREGILESDHGKQRNHCLLNAIGGQDELVFDG